MTKADIICCCCRRTLKNDLCKLACWREKKKHALQYTVYGWLKQERGEKDQVVLQRFIQILMELFNESLSFWELDDIHNSAYFEDQLVVIPPSFTQQSLYYTTLQTFVLEEFRAGLSTDIRRNLNDYNRARAIPVFKKSVFSNMLEVFALILHFIVTALHLCL